MKVSNRLKKHLTAAAVGVIVCLITLALRQSGLLAIAELKALDHRYQQYADPAKAGKDIVLVAVDEASLEVYGRWPWPRDRHGYAVQYLHEAGAKAIIFDILFLEPDENAEEFDQSFAEQVRAAGNVFLPILLQTTPDIIPPRDLLAKATIRVGSRSDRAVELLDRYHGVKLPIPPLAEAARGFGFINLFPDSDGTTRRLPLLAGSSDGALLQLAAAAARYVLDADRAVLGRRTLSLGPATIPLTAEGEMVIDWHGSLERKTYPAYSMGAVLRSYSEMQKGKKPFLDPVLFRDKIVFIATTAAGTYDLRVTPLSPFTPGVLIHMAALDNILRSRYMRPAPYWVFAATILALCLGTAWGFMLLQRQTAKIGLSIGLAVGYYGLA
ncbi:MAG: CHASE2 domain-containing protein, partial [Nitrospirota bacterium]